MSTNTNKTVCPACGAENEKGDLFCTACGSSLPSTEEIFAASDEVFPDAVTEPDMFEGVEETPDFFGEIAEGEAEIEIPDEVEGIETAVVEDRSSDEYREDGYAFASGLPAWDILPPEYRN